MSGALNAAIDGAAAVILIGAVVSAAQWLLARIYGETQPGRE